eukprot:m.336477 g.336477  ORF g.336477 m.336477 type:complete len:365 (+) comp17864_c0_seq1:198-1292(+)
MCGGNSTEKMIAKEINRQLKKNKGDNKREFKLLLLGTGESGKSTVLKQMQIIYGGGFKDDKKQKYIVLVYRNILRSVKAMHKGAQEINITIRDSYVANFVQKLVGTRDEDFTDITPSDAQDFLKFWNDKDVQMLFKKRKDYYLPDSTGYFFSNLNRIGENGYSPTEADILHAREATTGIHEYTFDIREKNILFRMIDVGGQRSERKKWIHCFESVTSIVFIVACSEFDQVLAEDHSCNRMLESLKLFEHIILYPWFRKSTFVLFLNKVDLLEDKVKVQESDIGEHFPEFRTKKRDPKNVQHVKEFIKNMYVSKAELDDNVGKNKGGDRVISHYTCATDTKAMETVFVGVKQQIVRDALDSYSLN